DFDEETWIRRVHDHWEKTRPNLRLNEAAKNKLDEATRKRVEHFRQESLKRQAINLYVSQAQVHAVDPDRLTRFISSLPEWFQASFQSLSPDEARRRASFAYRLVFPYPEEIEAAPRPGASATKGQAAPAPRTAAPERPKRKPASAGQNEAPF